jgi:methionyl-tRNA formyltransferase
MTRRLRTLFFGTSEFAVPSLRAVAQRTDLRGAVTQPDRPSGRGQKLRPTPIKAAALELGVAVYEPTRLKTFADEIASESWDLFVLASYGRILPQALLDVPRLGALNVHPSLLPAYRGATPIQTAIANGDRETGVSIMLMDAGTDTGNIVGQQSVPIEDRDDYGSLHDRLAAVGAEMLGAALDEAASDRLESRPQSGEPSITRPLAKEDMQIDWTWPPQRIVNCVRALSPQPGARAVMNGETVKVLRAHVTEDGGVAVDELIAPNRGRESGEAFAARTGARPAR